MKWGEVNIPVQAPSERSSASRCATVEPLPLVPATVMTGNANSTTPKARATVPMRASPMSMLFGCTDSCSVSHSASVRIGNAARGASGGGGKLQQHAQQRCDAVANVATIDDHVDRPVIEQKLAALEPLRKRLAHGLLDDTRPGKPDQPPPLRRV